MTPPPSPPDYRFSRWRRSTFGFTLFLVGSFCVCDRRVFGAACSACALTSHNGRRGRLRASSFNIFILEKKKSPRNHQPIHPTLISLFHVSVTPTVLRSYLPGSVDRDGLLVLGFEKPLYDCAMCKNQKSISLPTVRFLLVTIRRTGTRVTLLR